MLLTQEVPQSIIIYVFLYIYIYIYIMVLLNFIRFYNIYTYSIYTYSIKNKILYNIIKCLWIPLHFLTPHSRPSPLPRSWPSISTHSTVTPRILTADLHPSRHRHRHRHLLVLFNREIHLPFPRLLYRDPSDHWCLCNYTWIILGLFVRITCPGISVRFTFLIGK